jgi:hypothetical protein
VLWALPLVDDEHEPVADPEAVVQAAGPTRLIGDGARVVGAALQERPELIRSALNTHRHRNAHGGLSPRLDTGPTARMNRRTHTSAIRDQVPAGPAFCATPQPSGGRFARRATLASRLRTRVWCEASRDAGGGDALRDAPKP